MFLLDTNVISEIRKGARANQGVVRFFAEDAPPDQTYLSVITVGEIQRGVLLARHHGDVPYSILLDAWLRETVTQFDSRILDFDETCAREWAAMLVPQAQTPVDKQIASIARVYGLSLVTRNVKHFENLGVKLVNPFTKDH